MNFTLVDLFIEIRKSAICFNTLQITKKENKNHKMNKLQTLKLLLLEKKQQGS